MPTWTRGLAEPLIPYFLWIVSYINYYDPAGRVSSAYRSTTEQARLYRRYLSGLMPGPVAPPGSSYHEVGRAIDVLATDEALAAAGAAWESVGGTWGGHFKTVASDPIHFQA
jgi:hypothetical protein